MGEDPEELSKAVYRGLSPRKDVVDGCRGHRCDGGGPAISIGGFKNGYCMNTEI